MTGHRPFAFALVLLLGLASAASAQPQPAAEAGGWAPRVSAAIARQKRYPAALLRASRAAGTPAPSGRVVLKIALNRQGRIAALSVSESSGVPALDKAALDMVRRAAPLPKPPAAMTDDPIRLTLPVNFRSRADE